MKVYADVRALSSPTPAGVARYIESVINDLAKEEIEVIGIGTKPPSNENNLPDSFKFIGVKFPRFIPESLFILFFLPFFINRNSIYLGFNHCIPIWGVKNKILFVHDFVCFIFPETQTFSNRFLQKLSIILGLRMCDQLVFVSEYTREIFRELFPDRANKQGGVLISNIPVVSKEVTPAFRPTKKFILTLGSIEPRKNLVELVEAFARIKKDFDVQLLIAGGNRWKSNELSRVLSDCDFRSEVIFLGYLSDGEISWYMKNCDVFCFPSLYEGFGIPPFEALMSGAKVVGTSRSELRYFEGTENLFLFTPGEDDLANKLRVAILAENRFAGDLQLNFDRTELRRLVFR